MFTYAAILSGSPQRHFQALGKHAAQSVCAQLQELRVQVLALPIIPCVVMGKLVNLLELS